MRGAKQGQSDELSVEIADGGHIQVHEVVVATDRESVADLAADYVARVAGRFQGPSFNLALCGGVTPILLYRKLAEEPFISEMPWEKTHLWWCDERVVGPDSLDSNYRMARQSLIDRVPIPASQVHRVRGELGAEKAASQYRHELVHHLGPEPKFSLTVLSIGPDGNIAAIFPNSLGKRSHSGSVAAAKAGDQDTGWVTITLEVINRSDQIVVLAQGVDRAEPVKQALIGDPLIPASHLAPAGGEKHLHIFLDSAAASEIGTEHR